MLECYFSLCGNVHCHELLSNLIEGNLLFILFWPYFLLGRILFSHPLHATIWTEVFHKTLLWSSTMFVCWLVYSSSLYVYDERQNTHKQCSNMWPFVGSHFVRYKICIVSIVFWVHRRVNHKCNYTTQLYPTHAHTHKHIHA